MYQKLIHEIHPSKKSYSRDLIRVCVFSGEIAQRLGDHEVHISEFIVAKILGYVDYLRGHPEVTKMFLIKLPVLLLKPKQILMRDDRPSERYIICGERNHRVVLEIKRNGIVTEINTIHLLREENLRKLEKKCIKL